MLYILDNEPGMNTSLTSKDINITYTNDNSYTISNVVNNKIDEIVYKSTKAKINKNSHI